MPLWVHKIKNNENYLEVSKIFVIFVLQFFEKMMPEWWNGRHGGLKILWAAMPVRVRLPPLVQIFAE